MQLLDLTLATMAENLALEEALLLQAEEGGPEVLRLWEWRRPAVVLGAAGRLAQEVNEDVCKNDGIPILRRSSGGGAVMIGAGCLNFSLILRFDHHPSLTDLHASYQYILGKFEAATASSFRGTSDLAFGDRKISGNAQQRKLTHLLHHGTLLYAFDIASVGRYLKSPPRQPEYRVGRSHEAFLVNMPIDVDELMAQIKAAWPTTQAMTDWPMDLTKKLAAEKYANPEWIRRR